MVLSLDVWFIGFLPDMPLIHNSLQSIPFPLPSDMPRLK